MTTPKSEAVRLGFQRSCIQIPLDQLHYTIDIPSGVKQSIKYRQIVASIKAVGLVEPVAVTVDRSAPNKFLILDGRLRLEALRDIGAASATCMLSTDDEGYTYNKYVNRLSVIQEHRMILRAVERGVSIEQLSAALDISPSTIRDKFRLLEGISEDVATALADKPVAAGVFRLLRKMRPFRQIDAAHTMINLGDYSIRLATALLQNTPAEQLLDPPNGQNQNASPAAALQRLERELAALQADTKLLEESYGPSSLQLEIVRTYVRNSLLNNASVVRWLASKKADYLQQLQRIADIRSADGI